MTTTLDTQVAWYLDTYLAARPASPRTIATYRSELAHLQRYAALHQLTSAEQITPDHIRKTVAGLLAIGRREADTSRSKGHEGAARIMLIAARGLFRALREQHGIPTADLRLVELPRVPERLQPRVQSDDFLRMEAALDVRRAYPRFDRFVLARDAALVLFLFETGLRASEVSRLDLDDVDLATGHVMIHQAKSRRARRVGFLDPDESDGGEVLRRLRAYVARRSKQTTRRQRAFWIGKRGQRLTPEALRELLRVLCEEAGLEQRPVHAFRRGWFSAAYRADPRDLPILSARMGWNGQSQRMAAVYTRGAMIDLAAEPRPLISRCLLRDARQAV